MLNKNLKDYFEKAQKERWAIGQFNISNLEALRAIVQATKNLKSPVVIGTSEGESKFLGLKQAVALVKVFRKETGLPIFLNLDHGKSFEYIKRAIKAGYDNIHFDGSGSSLEKNIAITKKIAEYCHRRKVLIEGEINSIAGSSEILKKRPEIKEVNLTKPKDALKFIKETKVDSLAINIGTFHGMEVDRENPRIYLQKLREIKERIGEKVFLVLHGGSGTPKEDIKEAIKLGIVKININTELRVIYTETLKKTFKEKPEETTPYKYFPKVISSIQKLVEEKIKLFGSINKI
ncbi:MAG: class II fructose-bisphosphate aldolase family protein [Candidatus Nealsonbacteria bacterium]|nr:class II fructose-bisphosphate aldolase family protein [Candidatus Nealsonbacteria bacterium]